MKHYMCLLKGLCKDIELTPITPTSKREIRKLLMALTDFVEIRGIPCLPMSKIISIEPTQQNQTNVM